MRLSVFRPNMPLLLNNIGCVINVGQHLEHDRAGILQCVTYSLCETRDITHGFHWMRWYLCFYICMNNVQGWALMSLYYYDLLHWAACFSMKIFAYFKLTWSLLFSFFSSLYKVRKFLKIKREYIKKKVKDKNSEYIWAIYNK